MASSTLVGFASLPADTFADGPQSGADNGSVDAVNRIQPISANGRTGPFDGQPIQGFSAVQFAPDSDGETFWFLSDNGFGGQFNSTDYLLRLYQVDPNFAGSEAGDSTVEVQGFVQLADPNNLIPFDIVNEGTSDRLLTGGDFDIESFVIAENGDIWVGEEFGPFLLNFDSTGVLLQAPIATPSFIELDTLNGQDPLVIAHRGASGDFPEHTLEAYRAAIAAGADFIEPDLAITSDGVLIARHEPTLAQVELNEDGTIALDADGNPIVKQDSTLTTNIAELPQFADRLTVKNLDGALVGGWFAEDFTFAELEESVRARQPRDFRDQTFNDLFKIPSLEQVIELVQEVEAQTGVQVGIYPETKHPTFFDAQDLSLEEPLVQTLLTTGFTDPDRIFIQSFEVANLIDLSAQLEASGLGDIPLVQLFGDIEGNFINAEGGGFSVPFDFVANTSALTVRDATDIGIRSSDPDTPDGGGEEISVDQEDNGPTQGLLQFNDIGALIPDGATLASASLNLFTTSASGGTVSAFRMLQDWDDNSTWSFFGGDGVQPDGVEAATDPSFTIPQPVDGVPLSIDVTEDVNFWLENPDQNFGWAFDNDSGDGWDFFTSEFEGDPDLVPQLVLTFEDATVVNLEELRGIYGDLVDIVDFTSAPTYADLANQEAIDFISTYAGGLGPWKNSIILREPLETPVDGNGDGVAEITTQNTGEIFPLIDFAHNAGLQVHPYTLRDEERFLTLNPDGTPQTPEEEVEQLIELGADGFFTDFPRTADPVRDRLVADEVRSPNNPDFDFNTLNGQTPLVIAHRGDSGNFPEHTLEGYRSAILKGADFIEPDLAITSDGVLIARHEPTLAQVELDENGEILLDENGDPIVKQDNTLTTNVPDLPQFGDRLTVKELDGALVGGWFAEDFTLEEIKEIRAVQSLSFRNNDVIDGIETVEFTNAVDNNIIAATPDTPGGDVDDISVDLDDDGLPTQGLLRFEDLEIPEGATLTNATLQVFTNSASDGTISAFQMIQDWDDSSTWNSFGGDGVQADGVEAASTASFTISQPADDTLLELDVTADVQAWLDNPDQNQGWVFLNDSGDGWDFWSSEFAGDPALRPQLSLTFDTGEEPRGEFDDLFEIPTLEEVIELVQELEAEYGFEVGIYPETKHPTFFDEQGLSLEEPLVETLLETGFTDPDRIFIQSFEIANLLDLRNNLLPEAGLDNLKLVQLFGDTQGSFINAGGGGFSVPFDLVANADLSDAEKAEIYGDLLPFLNFEAPGYDALANADAITEISSYADGIGPWKNSILLREGFATSEDRDGNGTNETILQRLTFDTTEGIFTGQVAYNSELFTGEGIEIVDPLTSLELDIDFFGTPLTEEDDDLFDFFPQLTLEDGVPVNLEYQILSDDLFFSVTGVSGDLTVEFEQGPVDAPTLSGEGIVEIPFGISTQLTGEVFPLIDFAHDAGLQVHPYTLRDENVFLTLEPDGTIQTPGDEVRQLIDLGADGFFTDFPETGRIVLEEFPDAETEANLRGSRGYEGMAFSPDRQTFYPMLEGTVFGDPEGSIRIYEFDVASSTFAGIAGLYQLDDPSHAIGDFTPINDSEFLVIERDGRQGADAAFKKIFKVDLSAIDSEGFVEKEEIVDLLNIDDPNDLNGDGETTFNFPFVTIEDVLVLDENTILVANDNNYPFSIGRDFSGVEIDNNEIITIELAESLNLDPSLGVAGLDSGMEMLGIETIDFEGEELVAGTVITDQLEGVTISTDTEFGAMVFDTSNPTGGDADLASDTLGNVMIISEDGDSSDADDHAKGGAITLEWDDLVGVMSVGLLDIDAPETGGTITLFGEDDGVLEMLEIPSLGENSAQTIDINTMSVASMTIDLAGSGAIAQIDYMEMPIA